MQKKIESIFQLTSILIKAAASLGVVFLLFYCGSNNFYPAGITIGDTFLFIFFSFVFSLIYSILFLLFYSMGVVLSPFYRISGRLVRLLKAKWGSGNTTKAKKFPSIPALDWRDSEVVIPGVLMWCFFWALIYFDKGDLAFGVASSAVFIHLCWHYIVGNPWFKAELILLNPMEFVDKGASKNLSARTLGKITSS